MKFFIWIISSILIPTAVFSQNVNIPDANFKKLLIDLKFDKDRNGEISLSEAENITSIYSYGYDIDKINNLTGIETFANIEHVYLIGHNIKLADFSKNDKLISLNLDHNILTKINLSKNDKLIGLSCNFNNIDNLDLLNNILLDTLICNYNKLSHLDISNNTLLTRVNCKHNTNLNICVSDIDYAKVNYYKDDNATWSINCGNNSIETNDEKFLQALIDNGVDNNNDGIISYLESNNVTILDVSNSEIDNLKGIEQFINIEFLNCDNNNLTDIDISQNNKLNYLSCSNNLVGKNSSKKYSYYELNKSIDISNNLNLKYFKCSNNNLTTLDISENKDLLELYCDNNNNMTEIYVWDISFAEEHFVKDENASWILSGALNDYNIVTKLETHIYPNPAKNKINIISNENGIASISDINGRIVLSYINIKIGENKINLNLNSGIYFLNIKNNKLSRIKLLIK